MIDCSDGIGNWFMDIFFETIENIFGYDLDFFKDYDKSIQVEQERYKQHANQSFYQPHQQP